MFHPAKVLLAVLLTGVVYLAVIIARPTRKCPRCKGRRLAIAQKGTRVRTKPCKKCSASGRVPWPLAPAVHRVLAAYRNDRRP